jgi:hypothetical protein
VFAKICHRGKSSLHRQAKVAACFSEEAFKQARAAAKQAGYPITFSIFEELATVDSAEVRDALLRETIEQRWKVRALRRAVAVRTGKAEAAPKRRVAAPAEASRPPDPYRGDKARASHATRAERIRAHLEGLHRETEEATDEEMEEVRPDLERELRHLRRKLGGNRTRGRVPVSGLGLADLPRLVSSVAEAVRTLRDTQRFPANPPAAASAS